MSLTVYTHSAKQTPTLQVVWLHGYGASGKDLYPLAQALDLPQVQSYCLQAPIAMAHGGWMWANIDNHQELPASIEAVQQWLRDLPTLSGLPLERTVLVGFSQGGLMSLCVGLGLPLALVISCSGYLLPDQATLHTPPPPVCLIHGTEDPVVPVLASRSAASYLQRQGAAVTRHEFAMGHTIATEAFAVIQAQIRALV